jgi:hypothetical protein
LLQCLAALQPERGRVIKDQTVYFIGTHVAPVQQFLYSLLSTREKSKAYFSISSAIYYGAKLTHAAKGKVTRQLSVASTSSNSYSRSGTLENVQGLICYGYGATRRIGKTSLSDRRDMFPSASLFYDTAELLNPEEWLLQADYAAIRQTRRRIRALRRRDQIKQVLLRLLPDVVDLRFSQSDEETFAPSVEAKTPYGWVRIQDLSLGYVTLISWIVDFASRLIDRYPSSNNPLAEPAVVLVDEIDLHLHPKWQRQLTSFLCEIFPNTQFIVTAHSPLVVQSAVDANIVLLRREGDHVVIDNNVEAVKNWRVDQVLTSDLFGLESARPPELDTALAERQRILSKGKLTRGDEKKLQDLEAQIGNLPVGETPEDMQAMDIVRRAAELLRNQ